jgi:hypothetical protein
MILFGPGQSGAGTFRVMRFIVGSNNLHLQVTRTIITRSSRNAHRDLSLILQLYQVLVLVMWAGIRTAGSTLLALSFKGFF